MTRHHTIASMPWDLVAVGWATGVCWHFVGSVGGDEQMVQDRA